ncbi:MAG: YkgJ family cysteine cluster protein [Candidatus Helarchaeales archaeon]
MPCVRCGKCCHETEMILSNNDVERISKMGYKDFYHVNSEGYKILNNKTGDPPTCIFFDPSTISCIIYPFRPQGCRFYPLIYEVDLGRCIIDDYCPEHEKFSIQKSECKKLVEFYNTIKNELETKEMMK